MNDIKIKINNLGPIADTELEIKKMTVIKSEENSAKILTKRFLKIVLSTLAYGPYSFQKDIAFLIRESKIEMEEENRYLSECLSILDTVLDKRKEVVNYWFTHRIHRKASELLYSYFKENQLDIEDFPYSSKIIYKDLIYMEEDYLKSFNIVFRSFLNNQFKSRKEFEKILETNETLLEMFKNDSNGLYHAKKLKYFDDSKIEISGTLFDKEIDSRFSIKDDECKINVNEKFLDYFNPNEIIAIENKDLNDFQFENGPSSIINEIYHSNSYSIYSYSEDDDIEKIIDNEFHEFYKIIGGRFVDEGICKGTKFRTIEDDEEFLKCHPYGMNTFAKLQLLFENKFLRKDSVLILDNVENYLTPKWQDRLAKLLVAMASELEISICLFSENDDFIKSLEKYTKEYELEEESEFYLNKKLF